MYLISKPPDPLEHCPAQRGSWYGLPLQNTSRGEPTNSSLPQEEQVVTSWTRLHIWCFGLTRYVGLYSIWVGEGGGMLVDFGAVMSLILVYGGWVKRLRRSLRLILGTYNCGSVAW